jgi:predicted RNA-binding protein associated with RNAse of E/G family
LNTPAELYPYGIRYVDLEVDVCVWPSGRVGKVDEKKLESAAAEGIVTQRLVETVKKKVQELMRTIEG